ncbi:hypothetical protein P3S67_025745 [Capsicum chacoense]
MLGSSLGGFLTTHLIGQICQNSYTLLARSQGPPCTNIYKLRGADKKKMERQDKSGRTRNKNCSAKTNMRKRGISVTKGMRWNKEKFLRKESTENGT